MLKNSPASAGDAKAWFWSLGQEDSLEEEMATHSSILAWKIPWTEESGRLQSMGSQRVYMTEHAWRGTDKGGLRMCETPSLGISDLK